MFLQFESELQPHISKHSPILYNSGVKEFVCNLPRWKEIKKTFYESSRDNLENDSYLKEMGNLQKQFRDHENSKLVDYNQALSDTLEEKKKDSYNINLLNIGILIV